VEKPVARHTINIGIGVIYEPRTIATQQACGSFRQHTSLLFIRLGCFRQDHHIEFKVGELDYIQTNLSSPPGWHWHDVGG
jgi:hypothetical protein